MDAVKAGSREHWDDRFNRFLWYGILGSEFVGSAIALKQGIILGKWWSGPVDAGVGMFETAVPYIDMFLGNTIATKAEYVRDFWDAKVKSKLP